MVLTTGLRKETGLLKRHVRIMRLLLHEPMGILRLSHATNLPMHQVRYSLRIMQLNDMLAPSTKGAVLSKKGRKVLGSLGNDVDAVIKDLRSLQA